MTDHATKAAEKITASFNAGDNGPVVPVFRWIVEQVQAAIDAATADIRKEQAHHFQYGIAKQAQFEKLSVAYALMERENEQLRGENKRLEASVSHWTNIASERSRASRHPVDGTY